MNCKEFRAALIKIMPGYTWTVHRQTHYYPNQIQATGTQSSGSNRLSTLSVICTERTDGTVEYEAKSSGYGTHAPWLHTNKGITLARALRGLQDHYQHMAGIYYAHAEDLKIGRQNRSGEEG